MNPEHGIDLGTPLFWMAVLAAVVVITPIVHARTRAIAIAIVDLSVAYLYVGVAGLPLLIAVVAGSYLACRVIAAPSGRAIGSVALGGGVLVLFVAYKLPTLGLPAGMHGVLAAIGFSYVALRAAELIRAVAERRHPPPRFDQSISYLLPFHMLAAGPIQAYDEFAAQPGVPAPLTTATALEGLDRIASGLFKKFVIAQAIRAVLLTDFTASGPYLWLEVQAYYVWVYLDFSAYSDIAVGIGTLLGRATPENFNHPLVARNITQFWERWHISLSLFIRRNLYIPIQLGLGRKTGNARPLATASIAIAVSFLLCGLWHHISWRFLAWGGIHAAGLIASNLYKHFLQRKLGRNGVKQYLARPVVRGIATVLTFEFVAFSLMFTIYTP